MLPAGAALLIAALLAPGIAAAQGDVPVAERVAVADALRGVGCRVDMAGAQDFVATSGIAPPRIIAALDSLAGDRLGGTDSRMTMTISPALCDAGAGADRVLLDAARLYRCRLTEAELSEHLAKLGADPAEVDAAAARMIAAGEASVAEGVLTVAPEVCALKPVHPDLRTAWIAAFHENDCRLDLNQFAQIAQRHGLPRQEDPLMSGWIKDGTVRGEGPNMYLDPALCAPEAVVEPTPDAARMVAALAASGCTAGGRELAVAMQAQGVGAEAASEALIQLMLAGTATDEGGRITLSPEACLAARPPDLVETTQDRLLAIVTGVIEDAIRDADCHLQLGTDTEAAFLSAIGARLDLPPAPRRYAADSLMRKAVKDTLIGNDHFPRDARGVVTFAECTP